MTETERYLRSATRGLWGKEKRALRTELQGHIHIRTKELMVAGFNESEAERQTLRELGAPTEVSWGMAGIYTLDVAMKGTVITSLLACVGLLSLQQVQAQVQSVYDMPQADYAPGAYLDFNQLKSEVRKVGGEIDGDQQKDLMLHLPAATRPDFSLFAGSYNMFTRDGKTYFSAESFLSTLVYMGMSVQIQGWENPKITVGQKQIQLQTTDWRVLNSLYTTTLTRDLKRNSKLTAGDTQLLVSLDPNGAVAQASVSNTGIQKGHIYALVVPQFNMWSTTKGTQKKGGTIVLVTNVVQASQNGQALFRAYTNTVPFKLVRDENAFYKVLKPYEGKLSSWSESKPAPALLLELTGKFGQEAYQVLSPSSRK